METIDLTESPSETEGGDGGSLGDCSLDVIEQSGYKVEQPEQSVESLSVWGEPTTGSPASAGDSGHTDVDIDGGEACDHRQQHPILGGGDLGDHTFTLHEEAEEKEPLSYELQQGYRILREVMSDSNKSVNWAFMDPVNADEMGLEDYYERIKNPIWLKKVHERFENREYRTITDFVRDFRLMLENCYRYNGPDHYISKRGQKLELVLEQKLTLLSRDLREKTSIAATSGKPVEDKIITGTRRRKVLVPHDSTALLNQLRQEEKEREREARRQQIEDKRHQQQAFLQDLYDWEESLLGPGGLNYLQSMWELPQIGHFLFLCESALNVGEVMQWELERAFWMPRQSSTMQVVMTSLLSTPYQRTRLDSKPPMPYKVWEEKLRTRVSNWYRIFRESGHSTRKTHQKLGLAEMFFKVVGVTNPLEIRRYHELTFYQRIWIMKGLCDWCLETQESVREALDTQPIEEQREYILGLDGEGNKYIHFPQFCGQDLRVYRIAPIPMPKAEKKTHNDDKDLQVEDLPRKKKKKKEEKKKASTPPAPLRSRQSRLRQNPRQVEATPTKRESCNSDDSGISESEGSTAGEPPEKHSRPSRSSSIASSPAPKGRSSRTSAAAREWIPRESTSFTRGMPNRQTRSRRLAYAVNASGTSTPTTCTTPSLSRESSPAPREGRRGSSSSTPSLDSSSRSSSPRKVPLGHTGKRSRGTGKTSKKENDIEGGREENEEDETETGDKCDDVLSGGEHEEGIQNEDSNCSEDLTSTERDFSVCGSSVSATKQVADALVNGFLDGGSTERASPPFSTYSTRSGSPPLTGTANSPLSTCDISTNGKQSQNHKDLSISLSGSVLNSDQNVAEKTVSVAQGQDLSSESHTKALECRSRDTVTSSDCTESDVSLYTENYAGSQAVKQGLSTTVKQEPADTDSALKTIPDMESEPLCETTPSNNPGTPIGTDPDLALVIMPQKEGKLANNITGDSCSHENDGSCPEVPVKQEPMEDSSQRETSAADPQTGEVKASSWIKNEDNLLLADRNGFTQIGTDGSSTTESQVEEIKKEETQLPTEPEVQPEIEFPEVGQFTMIADGVEKLRELTLQFAEPEPIVVMKGKKEKILRPPPRKKCVTDLYNSLSYLLKELEPWESKLMAANKKARLKMKKEKESYVEEPELQDVEDVWESEESVSEDSDEEDSDDDDQSNQVKAEPVKIENAAPAATVKGSKASKKPKVNNELSEQTNTSSMDVEEEELEVSSYGRIRKRRIIPNNIEEPPLPKRKKVVPSQEKEASPSVTPNILQSSKYRNPGTGTAGQTVGAQSVLSQVRPGSSPSVPITLPPGMQLLTVSDGRTLLLNTCTNPPVILQTSAPLNLNNLNLLAQLSTQAAGGAAAATSTAILTPTVTQPAQAPVRLAGPPVTTTTAAVATACSSQQVIKALLTSSSTPQQQPRLQTSLVTRPRAEIRIQPAKPPGNLQRVALIRPPASAATPVVSSASVQSVLLQTLASGTVATTAAGMSPPQVMTSPSVSVLNNRRNPSPPYYKYNDAKAVIRPPPPVTTVVRPTPVPSALLQTLTVTTVASPSITHVITTQSVLNNQGSASPQYYKYNDASQMRASIKQQLVKSGNWIRGRLPAVRPPGCTALNNLAQEGLMPQMPKVAPGSAASIIKNLQTQSQANTSTDQNIVTTPTTLQLVAANTSVVSSVKPAMQSVPLSASTTSVLKTVVPSLQAAPLEEPASSVLEKPVITVTPTSSETKLIAVAQNSPSSPTSSGTGVSPVSSPFTSPRKSPVQAASVLSTANLSPELLAKIQQQGIVSEAAVAGMVTSNTGILKGLSSPTRPKYASNVTVKSLLESRAARQKALDEADKQLQTPGGVSLIQESSSEESPAAALTVGPPAIQTSAGKTRVQLQTVRTLQGSVLGGPSVHLHPQAALPQPLDRQVTAILRSRSPQQVTTQSTGVAPTVAVQLQQFQATSAQTSPAKPVVQKVSRSTGLSPTSLRQSTAIDNAVRTIMTTVHTSLPTAQLKITSPFTTPGHPPMRQVTMMTSAMKSPIPSVPSLSSIQAQSGAGSRDLVISSGQTNTPGVAATAQPQVVPTVLSTSSGTQSQKNVMLRIVPQQMVNSQGVMQSVVLPPGVVLPQQLLQQAGATGNSSGKLVLQAGKGGTVQLVQAQAPASAAGAKPSAAVIRAVPTTRVLTTPTKAQTLTPSPAVVAASPVKQQPVVRLTASPNQQHYQQLQQLKQILNLQDQLQKHQQEQQQQQQRTVSTLVSPSQASRPAPAQSSVSAPLILSSLPPAAPVVTPGSQLTLSSAGLVPARNQIMSIQPNAGQAAMTLVNVPNPSQVAESPLKRTSKTEVKTHSVESTKVKIASVPKGTEQMVISSLDLLAAASLQKAKAEVPGLKKEETVGVQHDAQQLQYEQVESQQSAQQQVAPQADSVQQSPQQPQYQQVEPQQSAQQELAQQADSHQQPQYRQVEIKQSTLQQQQAQIQALQLKQHEVQLQQQQQKPQVQHVQLQLQQSPQQQLIKQIALQQLIDLQKQQQHQQQQPVVPLLSTATQPTALAAPGSIKSTGPAPSSSGPVVLRTPVKALAPSSKVATITNPTKTVISPPAATAAATTATTVQMAGVMANAGGRMVQLRFAVPAGMNVSQLLQLPQFQQQLASLQVSSIHGITTSTVAATAATGSPLPATASSRQSQSVVNSLTQPPPPLQLSQVKPSPIKASPVKASPVKASPVKAALISPTSIQSTSSTVALGKVRTVTAATTLAQPQPEMPATIMTPHLLSPVKTLASTSQTIQTAGIPLSQAQGGSGKLLLLNINGQLVQAQGLTIGARTASTPRLVTQAPSQVLGGSRAVTPGIGQVGGVKLARPMLGSVAGAPIVPAAAVSSKVIQQAVTQTPLVTGLQQSKLLSPSKLPVQALQGRLQQNVITTRPQLIVSRQSAATSQAVGQIHLPTSGVPLQVRLPTGVRLSARPAAQLATPTGGITRVSLPPGIVLPRVAGDQKGISIESPLLQVRTIQQSDTTAGSTDISSNLTNGN